MESVVLSIGRSLINLSLKHFGLFANLLSVASLTFILLIDDLTLSAAIVARLSALTVHAWPKHLHFCHHTTSFAPTALLNSAVLSTFTFALNTDALTVHFNFGSLSLVDFLEGNFEWVLHWLSFLRSCWLSAATTTSAKHLGKNIIHATAMGTCTFSLKSIFSIFVVCVALLSIRKYLICLLNFLEAFLVTATVGMVLKSSLAVSFFDISGVRVLRNTKQVVKSRVVDFFGGTAWAAHTFERKSSSATEEHMI